MSDSAHSQRRKLLPVALFDEITRQALTPLADSARHPDCFFEGLRVLAGDSLQYSVLNTPALLTQLPQAASTHLQAAFAKGTRGERGGDRHSRTGGGRRGAGV